MVFEACLSKEIIVDLTPKSGSGHELEPVILKPTWYQWRTVRGANDDAFIKITAQLVETAKIPSVKDFLPYTEWPPMVLHTKKSKLDLMIEEQEAGEELMSAALYVEEGQGEDEGAPQDGMAYLRLYTVQCSTALLN